MQYCLNWFHFIVILLGDRYEGLFEKDKKSGSGQFIKANGDTLYTGQWEDDVKSGYGVLWGNGFVYHGDFEKDLFNGFGTKYEKTDEVGDEEKTIYSGKWKNGEPAPENED